VNKTFSLSGGRKKTQSSNSLLVCYWNFFSTPNHEDQCSNGSQHLLCIYNIFFSLEEKSQ